jgi:hypothetical protein
MINCLYILCVQLPYHPPTRCDHIGHQINRKDSELLLVLRTLAMVESSHFYEFSDLTCFFASTLFAEWNGGDDGVVCCLEKYFEWTEET